MVPVILFSTPAPSKGKYDLPNFSQRLPWSASQNQLGLTLAEKRLAGAKIVDLTVANPTQALADYPHAEIAHALSCAGDFCYEPEALGSLGAREAIAKWYADLGLHVEAGRIAITASTSEAYSMLFKLLCDPGDEVLIPNPSYPLFEHLANADSVKTVPYRLAFDGSWYLDFDSLRRALTPRSKAIVLVNPNNPTGSFLKIEERGRLIALAAAHDLALISDEVFMTYPIQPDVRRAETLIGQDQVLCFSLNGLSKAAGMPQMKLGWIVVNGQSAVAASALQKLELLLDSYLSVGTLVQKALPALFEIGNQIRQTIERRLLENRTALEDLADSPIQALASEGGWSAILQVPSLRSEEIWTQDLLRDHDILIQPGFFYDMASEAHLVISLLSRPAEFSDALALLKRLGGAR